MVGCLGMETVWVEIEGEAPYRRPDFVVDGLEGLPAVLERIERGQ